MRAMGLSVVLMVLVGWPAWGQFAYYSGSVSGGGHAGRPSITVGGEAVVNVVPDRIIVRLGVETDSKDMAEAKQKNNDILRDTVAVAVELGIPEKAIKTAQLSIRPEWRGWQEERNFIGYFVRNTVEITLSDAMQVEELVSGALGVGVTYIHGIEYQTAEFKKHREHARELALLAAKEKAELMAGALGQTVGQPLSITENYAGSSRPYWSTWYGWHQGWGGDGSGGMSQVMVQADPGRAGEVTESMAFGMLSVRAGVSVSFALIE